jgi:hypothetical protein
MPEREADHSATTSAKVKNTWSYISTTLYLSSPLHFISTNNIYVKQLYFPLYLSTK